MAPSLSERPGPAAAPAAVPEGIPLCDAPRGVPHVVVAVGGERGFRRRLLELGLVPGTTVSVQKVAPLGDPLELLARGCSLSIRESEARAVRVLRGE